MCDMCAVPLPPREKTVETFLRMISYSSRKDNEFEEDGFDTERRAWRKTGTGIVEMTSRTWAHPPAGRREDKEPIRGRRLEASKELVQQLLASTGMKLIIEVSIRRRLRSTYESKDRDDAVGYPPPYAKYFLYDADGTITTVCFRRDRARAAARRCVGI